MTRVEKRIKLAEFESYKPDPETGNWYFCFAETCGFKDGIKPLPKYFEDLNAVHELEKRLDEKQHTTFREMLANVVVSKWQINAPPYEAMADSQRRLFISATAAQRCEALGKTLNLW